MSTQPQFIDMTPTWEVMLPAMVGVLENLEAKSESRKVIMEELTRMAQIADKFVAHQKHEKAKKELAKSETFHYTFRHGNTVPQPEYKKPKHVENQPS